MPNWRLQMVTHKLMWLCPLIIIYYVYDMCTYLRAHKHPDGLMHFLCINVNTHSHMWACTHTHTRVKGLLVFSFPYHSEASLDWDDMASLLTSERFSSTITHTHTHTRSPEYQQLAHWKDHTHSLLHRVKANTTDPNHTRTHPQWCHMGSSVGGCVCKMLRKAVATALDSGDTINLDRQTYRYIQKDRQQS